MQSSKIGDRSLVQHMCSRGSREYRFRLGFAVPKWLVPDLVLISTKSEFRFWIWFCQESKLSFGFGFGFVKNQN